MRTRQLLSKLERDDWMGDIIMSRSFVSLEMRFPDSVPSKYATSWASIFSRRAFRMVNFSRRETRVKIAEYSVETAPWTIMSTT